MSRVRWRTCRKRGGRVKHHSPSAAARMRFIFQAAALFVLHAAAHANASLVPRVVLGTGSAPAPTSSAPVRGGPGAEPGACPGPPCGWLVPGAWAGLTNQLYCIYNGLATAEKLQLAMVLPMMSTEYSHGASAKMVAFNLLYDEDFFISEIRRLRNLTVSRHLPEQLVPRCIAQLQMADKYARQPEGCNINYLNELRSWVAEHGVACIQSACTFARLDEQHRYRLYRPAVRPSALYEAEADAVVALIKERYNTTSFVAVHARVETDFRNMCVAVGEHEVFGGKGGPYGHKCFVSEAEIADYLDRRVAKHKIDRAALLFVATGDPLEALPTLCAQGEGSSGRYRCIKREMLKPQLGEGIPNTQLTRAYADFAVARRAQHFVGNYFSSFSRELAGIFTGLLHRKAEYYNPSVADEQARIAERGGGRSNPPPPPPPPAGRLEVLRQAGHGAGA